jgi:hypothetical protein
MVFRGPPGFIIGQGFTVSDTVYQYICINGGIIGAADETGIGSTLPLYAVATQPGMWAIQPNTIDQLVTSVPVGYEITATNPEAGLSTVDAESETAYRSRVLRAGLAASTGMSRYLKTLLNNVPGVQERLVSVQQNLSNHLWTILVGGGDPYQVAYAIYYALFDIVDLDMPPIYVAGITQASSAVVTTGSNHNLTTGAVERFDDIIGMDDLNGNAYPVTVLSPNTLSIPVDTTFYPAYAGGGIITPNPLNVPVSIIDYPDTYLINFVNPSPEKVHMTVQWRTSYQNYVSQAVVASLVAPALADYINSLSVGKTPINIYDMTAIFLETTANVMPSESVTVLTFTVSINNVSAPPIPGTGVIVGDPYMYFSTSASDITVTEI